MKAFKGFGPNVYPLGESRPPTNKFGDEWFLHGSQVTLFCFLDLKKPSSISLASFPMILIKIETVCSAVTFGPQKLDPLSNLVNFAMYIVA